MEILFFNSTTFNMQICVESFPQIVEPISTNKKCLHKCRHEGLTFKLSLKAIGYLLFQIKDAAPKTAASSSIPEANILTFPL